MTALALVLAIFGAAFYVLLSRALQARVDNGLLSLIEVSTRSLSNDLDEGQSIISAAMSAAAELATPEQSLLIFDPSGRLLAENHPKDDFQMRLPELGSIPEEKAGLYTVTELGGGAAAGYRVAARRLTIFRPYQEIDLHAKVAGYLKDIRVEVGDSVRQGQLIATLEIPEFNNELNQAAASKKRSESEVARARSEVKRAQSVFDAAKLTYSRMAGVHQSTPKLLAQQEVDDALAKAQVAEAQLGAAKASLAVAEEQVRVQEANEARAKTMANYTVIAAPFSGLITKRYADRGAMIQAGTASQTQAMPVVRLSQVDRLRLILPAPESVVPQIRIGRHVKIKVPALDQSFDGLVARFTGKVDPATRTMETEVDVANPRRLLKPGMYAYADLSLELKNSALTVPVLAVSRKDKKASVLVSTRRTGSNSAKS